ncbi:hypothetical protein [Halogeometricum sp. CBA1124]|uniref:DUF7344 domain-containing protein n=1 Tax=Halogeometricum sp. CBA1124 TaxID=2668071 RepID=UPI00142AA3FB|nr:hypothetical protein [Halogeometricum sp. CBA1124]MUV58194.1 hypothetical protein [Halogeometricum sp. CBA1124]
MGARDSPAHDSAYDSTTTGTRPGDDRSDRYVRISRDDAFHLLQNDCRRAVLRLLLTEERDDPTPLSTLAAFVAAVKYEGDDSDAVGEVQERVRIALHHSHLPLLAEHGVVDYDPEAETVAAAPLLAALAPFLSDGLGGDDDLVVDTVQVERHGHHDAVEH